VIVGRLLAPFPHLPSAVDLPPRPSRRRWHPAEPEWRARSAATPSRPPVSRRLPRARKAHTASTVSSWIAALLLVVSTPPPLVAQVPEGAGVSRGRHLETFPIMAIFRVYSAQYSHPVTERTDLIIGAAYVNVDVQDRTGATIGRLHAPTVPIGARRYLWRNAHVEYQLWPAYNSYLDYVEERYHHGFDLYSEARAGYRFDFSIRASPLFTRVQYVVGFGIYPGDKPENFLEASSDAHPFHVPSASIGIRF